MANSPDMQTPLLDIPNFRLLRPLGEGGTSWVYLAEQLNPRREVAVKIVPPQPGVDEGLLESLRHEGDVAAQFHHDNLVTVFDCGIVNDHYFLAMEFLPGGDLQSRIASGISLQDAIRITAQIAAGLSQLHSRGVVHRDVKPGNVMFHENGRAVLVDFAIAKPFSELGLRTQKGFVTGTPLYMSPEQFQRRPLSARSDLYSLGVMFYQMLSGNPPFRGLDPMELRDAHMRDPPPPLPAHLSQFQPLIDRLLAKDPQNRYASAAELIGALNEISHQVTGLIPLPTASDVLAVATDSTRGTAGQGLWRLLGANKALTLTAAALAMALLAAAVVGLRWMGMQSNGTAIGVDRTPSIAVLPFADMSRSGDQEYFSDGLADTLLNLLAKVPGLKVAARTSSFSFKGQDADVREIAKQLGVSAILEGSVQKEGNRIRVIAQLINALDGKHLWSEHFDRDLEDIFSVQDEIAAAIVKALEPALVTDAFPHREQLNSSQIRAYDLYLLGRHYWHQRTAQSISRSIELFHEAIELNPEFVQSYTGLADAYNLLTAYGDLSGPRAAEMMAAPVARARELDDSLAEVHTSYGAMKENLGDLKGAEEAYRRAIGLNRNYALAYMWLGNVLIYQNRLREAGMVYLQALNLDPLNIAVNLNVGRVEVYRGALEEALVYVERARLGNPRSALTYQISSAWLRQYGRLDAALEAARQAQDLDPEGAQNLITLAEVLMDLGELPEAEQWIGKAGEFAPDNWQFVWLQCEYYFISGDYDSLDAFVRKKVQELEVGVGGRLSMDWKVAGIWRGLASMLREDYAGAVDQFQAAGSEEVQYHLDIGRELAALGLQVVAHRNLGQAEQADGKLRRALKLGNEAQEQGWASPDFVAQMAAISAVSGDFEDALERLAQAAELGFRRYLLLQRDPSWSGLWGDRRFLEIIDMMKADVQRMRGTGH